MPPVLGADAAIVFGVISAKIKITKVRVMVAMAMPASPNSRIAMTVAIAEARIFTRLLPISMSPMSRSGRLQQADGSFGAAVTCSAQVF